VSFFILPPIKHYFSLHQRPRKPSHKQSGDQPKRKVKTLLCRPFVRFRKTCFFFSGHSHTYERFKMGGKFFVVTGGGGGPRHKVSIDPQNRRFDDLFPGPGLRFFHFREVENRERVFDYKLLRLEPNGTFTVADSLTLS